MIKYIYTFFVALFLAIFVGFGISVFYESPKPPAQPGWYNSPNIGKTEPTEAQRLEETAYNAKMDEFQKTTMSNYNRNVSVIVLVVAVVILVISLVFETKLGIISDGILLGGIFTLLYGVGRGINVDSNKYRFLVATIGLLVTIALGYIKFVPKGLKVTKR